MRRLGASTLLIVVLALALAVAVLPWLRPDKYGIAAVSALILAIVVGGSTAWRWPPRSFWLVVLAATLLIPAVVIARGFGRVDMLAIAFHADFGTEGATLKGLESEITAAVLSALLITVALAMLVALWRLSLRSVVPIALALVALNPFAQFTVASALGPQVVSDLTNHLTTPRLRAQADGDPDLVIVYLEGTDRQFADTAVWGDVYAPLSDLASEGLSFTRLGQIAGTGWSLAGMIATQCGVPLLPRGLIYRNNYDKLDRFLPAQTCLGDVLAQRGYASAFVVGGDLGFGGIRTFYTTHQITNLTGLDEQRRLFPPDEIEAAMINWILDDQMVFETATQKFQELTRQDAPLALIVETIGPHGRAGYLSRGCSDSGRGEKSKDVDRVLRCTLKDMAGFLDRIRAVHAERRPGRGLRIVVLSDHLSHNPDTPDTADGFKGFNTAIFVGGPEKGLTNDRPGAMTDVYPTLLDWLGWAERPVAAGLGRSLLAGPPTLLADRGIAAMDAMLASDAALAAAVWADP